MVRAMCVAKLRDNVARDADFIFTSGDGSAGPVVHAVAGLIQAIAGSGRWCLGADSIGMRV